MKIVIDRAIPFLEGVFEAYADVLYKDGPSICRDDLAGADALVTRSRTRCDAALLDGTHVKMIATATIGTDHIDLDYCEEHGIFCNKASGCNAGGVMNYVFSALYGVAARKSIPLTGATIGIIGAGNVGSRVIEAARVLGFKVLAYDPYAKGNGFSMNIMCDLNTLLESSDIVTMHARLNDGSRRMADESFFERMKSGAIFINSAHGDLVVEDDLVDYAAKLGAIVTDTWSNEPDINPDLLEVSDIATPHIAGYSYQGKQIAAMMSVRAVARYFGLKELYDFFPETEVKELKSVQLDLHGKTQGEIASIIQYNYPIFTDDFMLRVNPEGFNDIRGSYSYRREFIID